jgi:tetratricopeptide (TPR) repeat protein
MGILAVPGISLRGDESPGGVRFVVDQSELTAFLGQLGRAAAHPQICPESADSCVPNESPCTFDAALKLRMRLVEGAQATSMGQHARAAECYRDARALCAAEGLVLEEALVLMALGGACLVAEAPESALESYRKAADLARAKEARHVECQAWLGVGGACLMLKRHEAAACAYRNAATAAHQGNLAILQSEALRMADACSRLHGQNAQSASLPRLAFAAAAFR